ncbi:MAG: type I 3-dehydroquinate dehydratase [Desulfobulbus sp.]|nr:MAG: type I 3-dehydroquinate dehydratase [Desulfobulbus sp.]
MTRGKICVSIAAQDAKSVSAQVRAIADCVDVVEVRLDAMAEPEVAKCCSLLQKPLLFTNRPLWEGGEFAGFEDDRIAPLFTAIELQAAYVDFELRADPLLRKQLLQAMESAPTRMIVSWHDFKSTPADSDLEDILQQMLKSGAHIGKIVTTAAEKTDLLRLIKLQEKALAKEFSLSCFAMGDVGRISRLATLYMGGYMSYGAVNASQATAPGQLSVRQLHALCEQFEKVESED